LPASPSTWAAPSSWAKSSSTSSACRWSRKPPPARAAPTKRCWKSWPKTTRCPPRSWSTARLSKLKGTYTDKLAQLANPRTGRVHTHYAQAVAVTGRLSSNDPNLQNIPIRTAEGRRVREAFVAPAGCVIASADYSQIELRIMAHISGDEPCWQGLHEGMDVHRATAAEVFGVAPDQVSSEQRRYAKVINFGLIYGMSSFGLARALGIDNTAAKNYIDRYFQRYPGVKRYMDDTRAQAKAQGYVETVFGRRLYLPEINSPNGPRRAGRARRHQRAHAGHGGRPDQAQHGRRAAGAGREQARHQMIMQVHDELVFEVPEAEVNWLRTEIPRLMAGVAALKVPLAGRSGCGAELGQGALVLVLSEIFGVHEYIADTTRRFARAGYLAIAPELFVRQGDAQSYGEMAKLIAEVISKVPDEQVLGDLDATVKWAAANGGDAAKLGVTGFCWGGRQTWLYAAHNPAVKAGVAWYGRLVGAQSPLNPRHPVDVAARLNGPVLGLYGAADTGIPLDTVDKMKAALAAGNAAAKASQFVVYPDAPHAFHADYRPSFRKEPAEDGWKRALAWFAQHGVA
jgi:dienelactone hydrolase